MSDRNSGDVFMSFVMGGLIGAIVGILYAPRSGKETRARLRDLGDDISDRIEDFGEDVKGRTRRMIAEGQAQIASQKGRIGDAIEAGRKAYDQQKERIDEAIEAGEKAYEEKQNQQQ